MQQDGELLLIDMDTLSTGHPIFEFGAMYATYVAFGAVDKNNSMDFLGIPQEKSMKIWKLTMKNYFKNKSQEELANIELKAAIIGFMEVLFLRHKYGDKNNEMTVKEIEFSIHFIEEKVKEIDSLIY
jgi:hypothetical protein